MPLSRRRKKKGKDVKNNPDKRAQRLEEADIQSGVSLQDLINVLAYQEYEKDGMLPHQADPETTGLDELKVIPQNEEQH